MNVAEIVDQIVGLSHEEKGVDDDLKNKALNWLNAAYHELMNELLPFIVNDVFEQVTLTFDVNGRADLPVDCRRVVSVFSEDDVPLVKLTREDFDAGDAGFFVAGKVLWVNPPYRAAGNGLVVRYIPTFIDLAEGAEIEMLPVEQHHALIWGALVWGSAYERAFSAQGDLRLFQLKWDEAKQNIKLFYAAGGAMPRVVAQRDM